MGVVCMKVASIIVTVLASAMGMIAIFYFGIFPAIGRVWSWNSHGPWLILGIVGALLLYELSHWLKSKAVSKAKQADNT